MMRRAVALAPLLLGACIPAGAPQAPAPVAPPAAPAPVRERPVESPATGVVQLPAPRPAWEVRPVTPDAPVVTESRYTVRPGDSLRLRLAAAHLSQVRRLEQR